MRQRSLHEIIRSFAPSWPTKQAQ